MATILRCKLALVASFKGKYSFGFAFKNEATRANLKAKKRTLKWSPFRSKVNSLQFKCI